MGALAAAGCAWSARGDPRYGGKWAWLARRGRCTASSWAQRVVCVNWRLSYTTVQATIALCAIVDCAFYSISFKEDEVSHKLGKLFQK